MESIITKHKEMVLRLAKPGGDILKSMTPATADLVHMGGCLMGEASELFDAVQEADTTSENLLEELGDFAFYLVKVRSIFLHEADTLWTGDGAGKNSTHLNAIELMRLGGHFWDVVKRIVVYQKDMDKPDSKYEGRTLRAVAVDLLDHMEQRFNALLRIYGFPLNDVLEANWVKLADADTGRFASGAYSDAQAQDRRDKRK